MLRVAFYSHDTFGLGHLRRCLKLAEGMQSTLGPIEGLLITGSSWADLFDPPPGFELAVLPPIVKRGRGYEPRVKGIGLDQLLEARSRRIETLLEAYQPDLLVVDNVPCGLRGEILPALRRVKEGLGTRCVLALRDVLDRTDRVRAEWSSIGADEALELLYDEIWVFGSEESASRLMELPGLASGVACIACGRLGLGSHSAQPDRQMECPDRALRAAEPKVLVTGGGGGDAMHLVRTYVEMLRVLQPPIASQIVLGPDFCRRTWSELNRNNGFAARMDRFLPDLPGAMARADVVVTMAGYNSICELEATGSRSVLVPRVWPREEQLIRAEAQERAGRAAVILPRELSPETLWMAIDSALELPRPEPMSHRGARMAACRAAALLGLEAPEREYCR